MDLKLYNQIQFWNICMSIFQLLQLSKRTKKLKTMKNVSNYFESCCTQIPDVIGCLNVLNIKLFLDCKCNIDKYI